jgi:hypothetical protein
VNDITRSNKLRTWFDRGGTMERKELGIDKDVSPPSLVYLVAC